MSLGEYFINGNQPNAINDDLLAFGLPPIDVEDDDFPVLIENWQAAQLFQTCSNQWRYAPMGGLVGLDAQGVLAVMDIEAIPQNKRPDLFARLRLIESGVLKTVSKNTRTK